MLRIALGTILLAAGMASMAFAETPPLPQRKAQSLETVQQDLKHKRASQMSLERKMSEVKADLEKTRQELVSIAQDVQKNEAELSRLEESIAKRSAEEKTLSEKLEQDYGSIANLILALERMRRIPPESLIVRPGAPLETAQSAMLLQGTLPAIHHRADQLSAELKKLNEITKALQADREAALTTKARLEKRRQDIATLIDKREELFGTIQTDYAENKRTVARLSKEAKTLMELITKLEQEEQRREATPAARNVAKLYDNNIPNKGTARLPVSGFITVGYGTTDEIGAYSQGIKLEARPGSLAVAPMGGIVRFAGQFKNYGNMVIIEHKNGYHSLIAGLHRIDAPVEGRINAGEPIGQLPLTSSRGGRPALYYELRRNGQPVNPADMIADLKS